MGLLSPGPGQKPHRAKNTTSEDELTSAAEIVIMLLPADATSASDTGAKDADDTAMLPKRLAGLMRRIGLGARISVPAKDAGEMLAAVRYLSTITTWAGLILGTLAIMVPAGMTPGTIITVLAIELAGFVIGTLVLALRRPHKNS
jgi:hypothetical protein